MNEIEWDAPTGAIEWNDKKKQRGYGEELARQGGLTARYLLEGPLQTVNSLVGDPAITAVNFGIKGINAFGANLPYLQKPSDVTTRRMDQAFPSPENGLERVVAAGSRAMAAGAPFTAAAVRAPAALADLPGIRAIASAPLVDITSNAVGGIASEVAKEAGAGPAWQLAAGVAAPMAFGAVAHMAAAPREILRPVTRGGAEQVAADVVGRLASDKRAALANLRQFNTTPGGVPGSRPMAAQAAGDYGLAGAQQAIARGDNAAAVAVRQAQNNAARLDDLARLNATESQIAAYTARRDQLTDVLRETTFETARGNVNYQAVANKIGEIASTPAGGRAESQKALDWIVKRLDIYASQGRTDARNAYELHKDIGALVAGKVADANGAPIRLAGGLANEVKKELATQIERVAPGFKRYLNTYSRLTAPIERLETIAARLGGQEMNRVTTALPSVTGDGAQFTLSQHQMRNAVRDIERDVRLAPRQRAILNRVLGDLNTETFATRGGKQPGSDTYQNMASANFVRRMLGDTIAESGVGKAVQAPLNFLNRPFESRVSDIVTDAFMNPNLMEELLRKSRTSRGSPSLAGLLDYSAPRVTGGLLGLLAQ